MEKQFDYNTQLDIKFEHFKKMDISLSGQGIYAANKASHLAKI